MTTTERPRHLLVLQDESATGVRAFAFATLWFLAAAGIAAGAFAVAMDAVLGPLLWLVFVLLVLLLALLALMLASDSIERDVSERFRGWAGRVYWLTTSVAVLAATPAVNGFNGAWGRDNDLGWWHIGHISTGAGPPAPSTQAPWRQPFNAMMCSDRWLHTAARIRSETSWVCPES
jgi:hypothetical protein